MTRPERDGFDRYDYPYVERGHSSDPRHAQPSGIISTPRTISEDEYRRIERRWRAAIKARGNALEILNPDGSHAGWFGRRPVWWKRAYYRLRMWLA